MPRYLSQFCIIFLFALTCSSDAKILTSLTPKDKTITQEQVLTLAGSGKNISTAMVNGIQLNINNDSFSCGLVLTPGKNFAKIEVWDKAGNYESYTRRILRLISYPDIEELYNNKPHWAKYLIVTLSTMGIIEGYPDGNYYANKSLTRGELATWIARAKGYKTFIPEQDVFKDVPKNHWRAPFIKEIVEREIMIGDNQGFFGIDMPISRGETALTGIKAEGSEFEKEVVSTFYDVPSSYPFYSQLKLAKSNGLIKGISWKTAIFEPSRDITRAEAAVLISRFSRVKWLKQWLYNFNQGYKHYCQINTPPIVKAVQLTPLTIVFGNSVQAELKAIIEDREGSDSILNVTADLSELGNPPDSEMVKVSLGYALQFSATPESTGEKTINITAIDKLGSKGYSQVKVLVVK